MYTIEWSVDWSKMTFRAKEMLSKLYELLVVTLASYRKKGHDTYLFSIGDRKKQCQNSKPFISDFKYDWRLDVKIPLSLYRILTFLNHGIALLSDLITQHSTAQWRVFLLN